jgi:hypothetical protein
MKYLLVLIVLLSWSESHGQWVQLGQPTYLPLSLFGWTGAELVGDYYDEGLSHSTDNGDTWQPYPGLTHQGGVDPNSFARRGNILMVTYISGLDFSPDSGGYYRSSDGGETWSRLSRSESFDLSGFASIGRYFFAINDQGGFWRSPDSGMSWQAAPDTIGGKKLPQSVLGFDVFNNELFAATYEDGIFRSLDSGVTWSTFNGGLPPAEVYLIASNNQYQFATLRSGIDLRLVVVRRKAGDTSWTTVLKGDSMFSSIGGLAVNKNYVMAGDSRHQIYISSDTGLTWHSVGSVQGVGEYTQYFIFLNDSFAFVCHDRAWRRPLSDFSAVSSPVPQGFSLGQSYPNPATSNTTISFTLNKPSTVSLVITDELGRQTSVMAPQEMSSGKHSVNWDARSFPSGIYTYRLSDGVNSQTRKLLLVK